MTETLERYRTVAAGLTSRIEGVDESRLEDQSPCTDWNAREVVVHVIRTHRAVLSRLDDSEAAEVEADGDLLEQWLDASSAVGEALEDEERAAHVVGGMFGEQSFESLVGRLVCTDTLVHTWDFARATGQDEKLDEVALGVAAEALAAMDEAIRRPGGFAPKIEPAPDADEQTRFLNFCGRQG
jgi:uncharacterized protein (TIGR03086 family)